MYCKEMILSAKPSTFTYYAWFYTNDCNFLIALSIFKCHKLTK